MSVALTAIAAARVAAALALHRHGAPRRNGDVAGEPYVIVSDPAHLPIADAYHADMLAVIHDHIDGHCTREQALNALYDTTRAYAAEYPHLIEHPTRANRWRWATDFDQIVADTLAGRTQPT